MLRFMLTPLRWFFRFVLYTSVILTLLVLLAPFAFDIPGRAEKVLATMNAGNLRGMRVQALPESVRGFPPELEIRDLRVTVPGPQGVAATAMTAAKVRVVVNVMESMLRGRVVLAAMVENPVIYANQPLNLGAIATAISVATGLHTQIQLVGGEVINPGSRTVVALGDDTLTNINSRSSEDQQVAEVVPQDDRGAASNLGGGGGGAGGTTGATAAGAGVGAGAVAPGVVAGVAAGVGGSVVAGTSGGGGRGPGTTPGGGGTNPGGGGTDPGGGTNPGGGGTNPGGGGTNPGGGGTNPGGGGTNPGGGGIDPGGGTLPGG
ncbi:MAG: hypothetical protein JHC88_15685, partial [Niveispirillum sp.]|nr:hypothetical protein [Niveispirillum sp.]